MNAMMQDFTHAHLSVSIEKEHITTVKANHKETAIYVLYILPIVRSLRTDLLFASAFTYSLYDTGLNIPAHLRHPSTTNEPKRPIVKPIK